MQIKYSPTILHTGQMSPIRGCRRMVYTRSGVSRNANKALLRTANCIGDCNVFKRGKNVLLTSLGRGWREKAWWCGIPRRLDKVAFYRRCANRAHSWLRGWALKWFGEWEATEANSRARIMNLWHVYKHLTPQQCPPGLWRLGLSIDSRSSPTSKCDLIECVFIFKRLDKVRTCQTRLSYHFIHLEGGMGLYDNRWNAYSKLRPKFPLELTVKLRRGRWRGH